jgi:hypothetical protein
MCKHFLIWILALMAFACSKDQEVKVLKEYYQDGSVSAEYETVDSVRNGIAKLYFPSGEIEYFLNYKDGHLEGDGMEYYQNGKLKKKATFIKGKAYGEVLSYFEDGNLASRGMVYADSAVGEHVEYYQEKNSQVKTINVFILAYGRGSILNSFIDYDLNGNIIRQSPSLKVTRQKDFLIMEMHAKPFDSLQAIVGPYNKFFELPKGVKPDTIKSILGKFVKIPYSEGDTVRGQIQSYKVFREDSIIIKPVFFSFPNWWGKK